MTQNNTPETDQIPLSQLTRQQVYDRIRQTSKDAVILPEMQRLGFWPAEEGLPQNVETLIKREAELSQTLYSLSNQMQRLKDPEVALREMRKERMAKARERREETRQKHAKLRFERAKSWHQRQQKEALYLGDKVSSGLSNTESNTQKLESLGLPSPESSLELATLMGVSLSELRFLAYERRVTRISHYKRFEISKKTGGTRVISAPMPRLKRAQYWILDNILNKVPVHESAHGFIAKRSIMSNAKPHVGQKVVANLDLKDFFPSILYPRVKGIFRSLGYSEQLSSLLGLLCTETPYSEVTVDNENFFVANGSRHLPQGAPTSPMLTNILCRQLDKRLEGLAKHLGFRYTRYADDMTFSADEVAQKNVGKLLWRVKQIIQEEGFNLHPEKQHVMRSSHQQQVTGLVVNDKLSIDRATMKRFRATLFQVEKDGPDGKQWNGNSNVIYALEGYARFIAMVDPTRAQAYLARIAELKAKHAQQGVKRPLGKVSHITFKQLSAKGQAPWEGWWRPAEKSEPVIELTAQQIKDQKKQEKQALIEENAPTVPATGTNQRNERRQQQTNRQTESAVTEEAVNNTQEALTTIPFILFQFVICIIWSWISSNDAIIWTGGIIAMVLQLGSILIKKPMKRQTGWRLFFLLILLLMIRSWFLH